MRKIIYLVLISLLLQIGHSFAQVRVRGYVRRDGTYVRPHYRSWPDGNAWNNWSTKGNINPYTGKVGTKTPYSRYKPRVLRNYYAIPMIPTEVMPTPMKSKSAGATSRPIRTPYSAPDVEKKFTGEYLKIIKRGSAANRTKWKRSKRVIIYR